MPALLDRITVDPYVCLGKPCTRGLRYPVGQILGMSSRRATTDDLLREYEGLERDDILAAPAFATRLAQVTRIQPTAA